MKFLNIVLLSVSLIALTGCWETSSGKKVGTIVKVAQEGLIWKTYEATLIRGGLNDGSGSFGKAFEFSTESEEEFKKLEKAMDERQEVTIHYHREFISAPWRSETSYFMDKLEIMEE